MGESSFWYRPTRVVPDQRPLNGRCCCCVSLECVVHCTDFASRYCLSYLLAALSSHAEDTRRAAYHCLRLYYDHLDAAVAHHRQGVPSLILYLLDCVRYSIQESSERLPCIVTTFLARAAYLLTTPGVYLLLTSCCTIPLAAQHAFSVY